MATANFEGTNYALQATPLMDTLIHSRLGGGEMYCMSEECVASGAALDAASTMRVGILPKGAVYLFSLIWPIATATFGAPDAMTNAVTGTLGTATDGNLFGTITALNAATVQKLIPSPDGTVYPTTLYPLAEEATVILLTGGAALTAAEGVALKIFYTIA